MGTGGVAAKDRRRSKRAEKRVAEYLWGPEAERSATKLHDLRGEDCNGETWFGEVKAYKWPQGPQSLWSILQRALRQCEVYAARHSFHARAFAVLIPTGAPVMEALVMVRMDGQLVVTRLSEFRRHWLGLAPGEGGEQHE